MSALGREWVHCVVNDYIVYQLSTLCLQCVPPYRPHRLRGVSVRTSSCVTTAAASSRTGCVTERRTVGMGRMKRNATVSGCEGVP
jgi:hypothetical protein